ncbi:hypothetical protein HOE22_09135 [Candidatus Woesearchaeota archaeon]|jgi:hypothetical protein|nr:hypothetical protein [Candidatus Woesearchaeota archaeon]MBT3438495.1 hypothetical protein [Candidatus Woesearchaeota archaeon]MBT4058575.1 hypothetical protein [Candidatus Woesearchaeota archaeon]MBT4208492.1 hypothetical protein [Candidatus Woesearchaeota archaeon]MBT4783020.1 hypothetical protein [Candidatus Woesearchaeota archaeon]
MKLFNKNGKRILILLVSLLIFSTVVNAFSVSPARRLIDYPEDLPYVGEFVIYNDELTSGKVRIEVGGEFSDYVFVEDYVHFEVGEFEKKINYEIKNPNNKVKPGLNGVSFTLTRTDETRGKRSYLGTRMALITSVVINVPYGGTYLETKLFTYPGDVNGGIRFVAPILNNGAEDVLGAKVVLEITDKNGKLIEKIEDVKNILVNEKKDFRTVWQVNVGQGIYSAQLFVDYGNGVAETEKVSFEIEGEKILLNEVTVNDFELGSVAKFEIAVKNIWDERVENIYAELEVYDIEGNLVETFVTDKKDLESGEKILLEGYWDTLEVVEGNYNTIVVVRYGDRLLERNVETIVSKEAIKTSIKIAGRSVTVVEGERTLTWTIIISLIVLSIVNLLWFMHFGRTKR